MRVDPDALTPYHRARLSVGHPTVAKVPYFGQFGEGKRSHGQVHSVTAVTGGLGMPPTVHVMVAPLDTPRRTWHRFSPAPPLPPKAGTGHPPRPIRSDPGVEITPAPLRSGPGPTAFESRLNTPILTFRSLRRHIWRSATPATQPTPPLSRAFGVTAWTLHEVPHPHPRSNPTHCRAIALRAR